LLGCLAVTQYLPRTIVYAGLGNGKSRISPIVCPIDMYECGTI
jgi:hypothetical protein